MDKPNIFSISSCDPLEQIDSPGRGILITDNSDNTDVSPTEASWDVNPDRAVGNQNRYITKKVERSQILPKSKSTKNRQCNSEGTASRGSSRSRHESSHSIAAYEANKDGLVGERKYFHSENNKRYHKFHIENQHEAVYFRDDGSPRLAPLKHGKLNMLEGNNIKKELEKQGILSAPNGEIKDPDIVLRELRHMGLVKNVPDDLVSDMAFENEAEKRHVSRLPPIDQMSNRMKESESVKNEIMTPEQVKENENLDNLKHMMFHLDLF